MAQTSRLVLEIDSRDAEQKAADTRKALEALEDAGLKTKPAMDKLGTSLDGMGKSADKSTKSVGEQKQEITELLGQIDPLKRKMSELERQERDLAQARKDGKIDLSTYNDYQAKLATTRAELTRFNSDMNRTGITAKQTAAALRGVPAQFTDIAVSLQGGQAPLTVFLQQGGQLKDMFGGAAPAAKALGGYVAGLISPLTVLAASTVALGAVYASAEKEVSAFNKALFAGTASSGQTTGSLAAVAKSAAAITGNLSGAKDAVIALASSTHLSQTQFTNLAQAAASIGEFSGKGAGEVAKNLADLGDNATKAAEKISSQYGLLTSAQYEVIHALDEQGKKQQALDTLTDALNTNAQARLKRYRESLSEVERDWNDIGTAISNAYARVKGALFPDTAKQIEVIEKILKTREEGGITGALSTGLSKLNSGLGLGTGDNDDSTEALQQKLTILKTGLAVNQQSALVAGQEDAQNQKRIAASSKFNALSIKELSDQAKLVKDIADARKLGVEAGKAQADIDKVVADIQAKYDDSHKQAKAKAYTEDAGAKALDAARQTYAVLVEQNAGLNSQGILVEKVGVQAQALIKWEQQLADIKSKQTLTADQKSLLASQDLITAQLKRNAAIEAEGQARKSALQAQKDQVELLTLTGQLREANSLKSSLDDAAQMAEYERQGNVEAAKRLQVMIKIRDINLQSAQKTGTVEGVSKAPATQGLDASVGGPASELTRLDDASKRLDEWRITELAKQSEYLDLKAISEETYAARVANIDQQAQDQRVKIEQAKNQALLSGASTFFGSMTSLSQSHNTKLAAIGKAAAIAQATIDGYVAVQKALAAFPPPFNFVAAAAVGVATAANVANIAGVGFSGGGYTGSGGINEPAGTVHRGEIVWSQADIQKFGGVASVEALRNGNVSPMKSATAAPGSSSATSQGGQGVGVTVQLFEDASKAGQVNRTTQNGQDNIQVYVANIMNDGELHQAMQQKYGLNTVGS